MTRFWLLGVAVLAGGLRAETTIVGTAVDAQRQPVEFVAVSLRPAGGGGAGQSVVTDRRGRFVLEKVAAGEYIVVYNLVGADDAATPRFTIGADAKTLDLGPLVVNGAASPPVKLEKVEVRAKQEVLINSIDRKVYRVGQDVQSATGSAGDLLQNLPSVQVDLEGNVSLRGSENVMLLINGRTSTLMGRSRAQALQQLPADAIERIEVITNPSAKYKPDGTGGIINLVLKRKRESRRSAIVNTSVGNERRYNTGVLLNYNAGPWNFFTHASLRQDDRERRGTEFRTSVDPSTDEASRVEKRSVEHARPFTRLARGGVDYAIDKQNKIGLTGSWDRRSVTRYATDFYVSRDPRGRVVSDHERVRYAPEWEESGEVTATFQHTFPQEDHELNIELKTAKTTEAEDNRYTNRHRTPARAATFENVRIAPTERETEAIVEYARPLGREAKLEAGYTHTLRRLDANFTAETFDPARGVFVNDATRSNRFHYRDTIDAFYLTYGRSFRKFGLLAGLRPEFTRVQSDLVTLGRRISHTYNRAYPSLHLAYKLTERHEFQWNYSHRVHRPDPDELNPFPEYADPFNVRRGNPALVPEDVHSIEAGYGFNAEPTTLTAAVYHRYLYHGFTSITRDIGGGVLLTTQENLSTSRSTGLELTANTELGKRVTLNFSSNTFFNAIDASNLGGARDQSNVSWSAKLGATFHLPKNTLLQLHTNYTSTRLTAQGSRRPTYVTNLGLRHEFFQKRAAAILTISDVFNSLQERSRIDTPVLQQEVVRRRSARIVYVGFSYTFGQPAKKAKDEPMKFDDSL